MASRSARAAALALALAAPPPAQSQAAARARAPSVLLVPSLPCWSLPAQPLAPARLKALPAPALRKRREPGAPPRESLREKLFRLSSSFTAEKTPAAPRIGFLFDGSRPGTAAFPRPRASLAPAAKGPLPGPSRLDPSADAAEVLDIILSEFVDAKDVRALASGAMEGRIPDRRARALLERAESLRGLSRAKSRKMVWTSSGRGRMAWDSPFLSGLREWASRLLSLLPRPPTTPREERDFLSGLVASLCDTYSRYFDPEAYALEKESCKRNASRTGIWLDWRRPEARALFVRPGSPASRAGLKAGDRILEVNGTAADARGRALLLLGDAKTLRLKVERNGLRLDIRFETEEPRPGPNSASALLDGGVGYVQLSKFLDGSGPEVAALARRLLREGAKSLVLDLRYDPGGDLDAAVAVASLFLEEGSVVASIESRKEKRTFRTRSRGEFADLPLAVLVNGHSASASEFVASALKGNRRALVIGERSYGKGSGQEDFDLSNGGGLSLTTFRWFGPGRTSVLGGGLAPDVEAAPSPEEELAVREAWLERLYSGVFRPVRDPALEQAVRRLRPAS
jgi:carboxyl-terminal processing protease